MTVRCTMILGDCLEVMPTLPKASVQMCFADFPYACTQAKWDVPIALTSFWQQYLPLAKAKWTLAATATLRFAFHLFQSAARLFRYDLVYNKLLCSGFLQARHAPLRYHEHVLIFGAGRGIYNPQRQPRENARRGANWQCGGKHRTWHFTSSARRYEFSDTILPRSSLPVMGEAKNQLTHSAQKPVALLDWLIRTYSNLGDTILDPVAGSFTTCVSACLNGRSSVGIEKDATYFEAGIDRVRKAVRDAGADVAIEVRR